jgi:diketogulonate reductase-like aldo/keto reductase
MNMSETLNVITELKEEGLARAIGVCNFNLPMIRHAVEDIGAPIAVHKWNIIRSCRKRRCSFTFAARVFR